jgi:hypothetical protein
VARQPLKLPNNPKGWPFSTTPIFVKLPWFGCPDTPNCRKDAPGFPGKTLLYPENLARLRKHRRAVMVSQNFHSPRRAPCCVKQPTLLIIPARQLVGKARRVGWPALSGEWGDSPGAAETPLCWDGSNKKSPRRANYRESPHSRKLKERYPPSDGEFAGRGVSATAHRSSSPADCGGFAGPEALAH